MLQIGGMYEMNLLFMSVVVVLDIFFSLLFGLVLINGIETLGFDSIKININYLDKIYIVVWTYNLMAAAPAKPARRALAVA